MRTWMLAASGAIGLTATGAGWLSAAVAQDPSADPYYGSAALDVGFTNDPYEVDLTAGGANDASTLGAGCVGSVGSAPDFELTYSAGGSPLFISATSDSDVSLVVNAPDGSWLCDDDSAGGVNPGLELASPQSGVYDIWVGRYGGESMAAATLRISELGFATSDELNAADLDVSGETYFGEVTLTAGFAPDPHSVYISAGGSNDASTVSPGCVGSIGTRPDYRLHYTSGSFPLAISATSESDLTLVVNTPDGSWACDDDGADEPLDPGLRWESPQSGTYDIWVGDFGGDATPDATLHISETGFHATRVDSGSGGDIDVSAAPTYGDVELSAGYTPDPYAIELTPGGSIEARTVGDSCVGQVASAPDVDLYYEAGSYPLFIYAESDVDTTLVINTPSGEWICDDDASTGVNPGVGFKAPESGLYDIWVGTYDGGAGGNATLYISETALPRD